MRIIRLLLTIVLSLATVSCQKEEMKMPKLIPREVLFGNPEKASPEISPDGKHIAYIAPYQGVLNVWVRDADKDNDKVITNDKNRGIRNFFWTFDNDHIIYVQDFKGDENWHIYTVNLETGEITDVTPFEGVKAGIVATDPNYPNEILISMNKRNEQLFDVYRLNLITKEITLLAENPGNVAGWGTDNNFKLRLATITLPDGGHSLLMRETEEDEFQEFLTWAPLTDGGPIGFTPSGESLYLVDNSQTNTVRLYEIDIKTKQRKLIAYDEEVDIGPVMVHPTKHHLQAVGFTKAKLQWEIIDESIKDDFAAIDKIQPGEFFLADRDLADKNWIVGFYTDTQSTKYYVFNRDEKSAKFLFTVRPDLDQYTLAPMEPVTIFSRDGLKMQSYLTLPVGTDGKNLPLILFPHGGPWVRNSWGNDARVQWMANRGYAVLQVNYRGSSGFGKDFLNAGNKEWGGKMQDDLTDAVKWAIKKGVADAEKVCIYGGSYGGYATLAGVAFTPELYKCGVDIVGPSNLITFLETIPPYWELYRAEMNLRVGDLEKDKEMLIKRSPLFSVENIKAPLLIAQGAHDPRVKKEESEQIVKALKEKDISVEYLLFEDEGHGFAKPQNRLKFFTAAEKFLSRHLGGRYEP